FQSCGEFWQALAACLEPRAAAPAIPALQRQPKWSRRGLWLAAIVSAASVAASVTSALLPKPVLPSVKTVPSTVPAPAAKEPPPPAPIAEPPKRQPVKQPPFRPMRPKPQPTPAEPDPFRAQVLRGDIAYQQNHYQDALAQYQKAYVMNPRD